MTTLDPTLFTASIDAVQRVVDGAVADYHERCFREQLKRDPELARIAQRPTVRVFEDEQQDAAEHFAEQMSPSDATFR